MSTTYFVSLGILIIQKFPLLFFLLAERCSSFPFSLLMQFIISITSIFMLSCYNYTPILLVHNQTSFLI